MMRKEFLPDNDSAFEITVYCTSCKWSFTSYSPWRSNDRLDNTIACWLINAEEGYGKPPIAKGEFVGLEDSWVLSCLYMKMHTEALLKFGGDVEPEKPIYLAVMRNSELTRQAGKSQRLLLRNISQITKNASDEINLALGYY
jgi:hypothetical protein